MDFTRSFRVLGGRVADMGLISQNWGGSFRGVGLQVLDEAQLLASLAFRVLSLGLRPSAGGPSLGFQSFWVEDLSHHRLQVVGCILGVLNYQMNHDLNP